MKHRRTFSNEFKRQVVEEYLSGVSTAAQLMRRHDISSGLFYHWKDQYTKGRFDNPPTQEAALEERVRQLEQLVGKLTLENEFLKKAVQRGLCTAEEKRQFIAEHRPLVESIERGCELMKLPRSTYYYKSKNKPDEEQALIDRIEAIIEEFPGYGYRRVTRELHRRGFRDNHKKVLRIMKQQGLTRKPKRRWVRTTNSNHSHRVYPNLVQNLLVTGPNQLWVADITYIAILSGFVYLAVILDLFARRAVGYALSRNIDTALCLEALRMALALRRPPAGIVHHSDRGVQYASHDYVEKLACKRLPDQHGPERQPLRQRGRRELHQDPEVRGGLPLGVPDDGRCPKSASLLHRRSL